MAIIRSGDGNAPEWSELEDFEILRIPDGETRTFTRRCRRENFIIADGSPVFEAGNYKCKSKKDGFFQIPEEATGDVRIWAWHYDTTIVRMLGHWEAVAVAGVSVIPTVDDPPRDGSPYHDEKTAGIDRHYHDYQEYWVFLEGEARIMVGEKLYDVGPGDCAINAGGWHHDVLYVKGGGELTLAWFGATPRGRKRIGHLHESENGPAVPAVPLP